VARRKYNRKRKAQRPTSVLALCLSIGFFLGIGLGALMNMLWAVRLTTLLVAGGIGYAIDRRNGVSYLRHRQGR